MASWRTGIGAPVVSVDQTDPINLVWTVEAAGSVESLYGPYWTQVHPAGADAAAALQTATAALILPKSHSGEHLLDVRVQQVAGNLPVSVKIVFVPRRRKVFIANCDDKAAQSLSAYRVSPDDIIVYDGAQSYEQNQDFEIDLTNGRSDIVPRAALVGKTVNVQGHRILPRVPVLDQQHGLE